MSESMVPPSAGPATVPEWVGQLSQEITRIETAVKTGNVDVDEAIATLERVSAEIQARLDGLDAAPL